MSTYSSSNLHLSACCVLEMILSLDIDLNFLNTNESMWISHFLSAHAQTIFLIERKVLHHNMKTTCCRKIKALAKAIQVHNIVLKAKNIISNHNFYEHLPREKTSTLLLLHPITFNVLIPLQNISEINVINMLLNLIK